ncbi:MAG: hypothetical protein EBV21_04035, partial [Betaproteobacteria bacterium]|nr:hypothetical protein [Betaproteobacteria bacterium]
MRALGITFEMALDKRLSRPWQGVIGLVRQRLLDLQRGLLHQNRRQRRQAPRDRQYMPLRQPGAWRGQAG